MAWLDDNPPARGQFRIGRRAPGLRPQIALHTAESVMDTVGLDTGAEAVARFIQNRQDPGSYHRLVDSDSTIALVELKHEAFHVATHDLNRSTMGLSWACSVSDWRRMSAGRREAFFRQGVKAAVEMSQYALRVTGRPVPARRLSLPDVLAGRAGFFAHGTADPERRSDPGIKPPDLFPWDDFFTLYARAVGGALPARPTPPRPQEADMRLIQADGRGIGLVGAGYFYGVPNAEALAALVAVYGPPTLLNAREFDLVRAAATHRP